MLSKKRNDPIENLTENQLFKEYEGVDMSLIWRYRKGQSSDVYFVPAFCRVKIQNRTAELDCRVQVAIRIDELDDEIVKGILKKGIRLSFNADEDFVDLHKNNKNVRMEKTNKLLTFIIDEFIMAKLRVQQMLLSPFNLINCELIIRLNRIKLDFHQSSGSQLKLNRIKSGGRKSIKNIEIHFNFMNHQRTEMKINCSGQHGFGQFFIAFSQLSVSYLCKRMNLKKTDEDHQKKYYQLYNLTEQQKQARLKCTTTEGEKDFEEKRFLIMKEQHSWKKTKQNKPQGFDFAHFNIPIYKKPNVAMCNIFIPLIFLACLNLAVFFQSADMHKRIVSIGGMLLAFVALIGPIRQQMPEIPDISFIEIIVLVEASTTVLTLAQSLHIRNQSDFALNWQDYDGFFLTALIVSLLNFCGIVALVILYIVRKRGYQKDSDRFNCVSNQKINLEEWHNNQCNRSFEKHKRQGVLKRVKKEQKMGKSQGKKILLPEKRSKAQKKLPSYILQEKPFGDRKGLVRIENQGKNSNITSALQCLSNTKEMTNYFMSNDFFKKVHYYRSEQQKILLHYAKFIRKVWGGSDPSISANDLKQILGKKYKQLFDEQHEIPDFLTKFFQALQQDFDRTKSEQFVQNLTSGLLKSTIICHICQQKQVSFQPYKVINLNLPSLPWKNQLLYISADLKEEVMRFQFQYDDNATFGHLKTTFTCQYHKYLHPNSQLYMTFMDPNQPQIIYSPKDGENISQVILFYKDLQLVCYEKPKQRQGFKLYLVQYWGFINNMKKKIGYPQYINLPLEDSSATEGILIESFSRWTQNKNEEPSYYFIGFKRRKNIVEVKLKPEFEMLALKDEKEKFKVLSKIDLIQCLKSFASSQACQFLNEWYCKNCKIIAQAQKKVEIQKTSKIFIIAFPSIREIKNRNSSINFPINQLDMTPYVIQNSGIEKYELYAMINQDKNIEFHYTATCQNFLDGLWYNFDDNTIQDRRVETLTSNNAYVLFYRRKD